MSQSGTFERMVSPGSWDALRNVTQNLQSQMFLIEKREVWEFIKPGGCQEISQFYKGRNKNGKEEHSAQGRCQGQELQESLQEALVSQKI